MFSLPQCLKIAGILILAMQSFIKKQCSEYIHYATVGYIALITPKQKNAENSGFYFGLGGNLRARNENILFGTIELRFMYFPGKSLQHDAFKLTINTNLRFRYNNSYVNTPDIIQLNSDYNNNIY